MNVLLTNDDGIHAQGLWALYSSFAINHRTVVVAPDRERSAIGHAITLNQPLRATKISLSGEYSGYAFPDRVVDKEESATLERASKIAS